MRQTFRASVLALALVPIIPFGVTTATTSAAAQGGDASQVLARTTEVSETARLTDRRALVSGERAYAMGDAAGLYPATGWHIRGEMGGYWSQPIKLLDGMWFAVDGRWLGTDIATTRYTRGWGYQRFDYAPSGRVGVQRVEFAPHNGRSTLVGLVLTSSTRRDMTLSLDAHSELMPSYPWGWTTPSAGINGPDTGTYENGTLAFRDHDYTAVVGSSLSPAGHSLGSAHRGPVTVPVICPAEGQTPLRCDDSAFGRGTGGRLDFRVRLEPRQPRVVWFAVAGSDTGSQPARNELRRALADPAGALRDVVARRGEIASRTTVDLPGDPLLQRSVEWSKQNLADSVQRAEHLRIRDVDEGRAYPEPVGTVASARWSGAGFPDYPWLFATDGEYTAYASIAAGQFDVAKDHLRALRDVSDLLNRRSGKVAHEIVPTGDVYFGANDDAGNTDETVKFPSIVALVWRWTGDNAFRDEMYDFAVRNLRYVEQHLDADHDGWLEGLGNVERPGMGVEKLDSTVYHIRGLDDLADLAAGKGDEVTRQWASAKADGLRRDFHTTWWVPDARGYAESIDDPADPANDNRQVFQRHWTGVTPMEAAGPGAWGPIADRDHAEIALGQRERDCYTGEFGLYHTGSGPTSAPAGNPGPSCDPLTSTVPSERATFSLNTAVMAVAEGNFGRSAQQRRYTTGNARIQLDPAVWETPGAMPEVAPSPDFIANIDRPFTDRSMMLQAWGTYGVLWPVVHQQLGIDPDIGNAALTVVPHLPEGTTEASGRAIQVGRGELSVSVRRNGNQLTTKVSTSGIDAGLTVGAVLPQGMAVSQVRLDGKPATYRLVSTSRGTELQVETRAPAAQLQIVLRPA